MANDKVFHIEIDEGSDYTVTFNYLDEYLGTPVNLTGYTVRMMLRVNNVDYASYDMPSPQLAYTSTPTTSGSVVTLGGTAGTINVYIAAADTTNLVWDKGMYDIFLTDTNGKTFKFIKGFFTVMPSAVK